MLIGFADTYLTLGQVDQSLQRATLACASRRRRGLVLQAAQRDVAAIKEVFDRIAGRTSLVSESDDMLERLSASWRDRLAQMRASNAQPTAVPTDKPLHSKGRAVVSPASDSATAKKGSG